MTAKEIYRQVNERSQGLCEVCSGNHMVQRHHLIGGSGKRNQCATVESVKCLCYECHHGKYGIHGNHGKELNRRLREELQETYTDMGYSREKIFWLMGDKFYNKEG